MTWTVRKRSGKSGVEAYAAVSRGASVAGGVLSAAYIRQAAGQQVRFHQPHRIVGPVNQVGLESWMTRKGICAVRPAAVSAGITVVTAPAVR